MKILAISGSPRKGGNTEMLLKDALNVTVVQEAMLRNPSDNIRIGATILNHYWQKMREDFPKGFSKPLSADANAVAIQEKLENVSPTAVADTYTAEAGRQLVVGGIGVLSNDVEPDLDRLTATLDVDVSDGVLDLNQDGSFTYSVDSSFVGDVTFEYTAFDGTDSSASTTATISPSRFSTR